MVKFSYNADLIANFAGKGALALAILISTPFYLKLLGIKDYGLIGFYQALIGLSVTCDFGLGVAIGRFFAQFSGGEDHRLTLLKTAEWIYWVLAFCIGAVAIYFSSFLFNYFSVEMGIALASYFPFFLYSQAFSGLQRHAFFNSFITAVTFVRHFGAILLIWLIEPSLHLFFLWQIGINLFQSLILAILLRKTLPRSSCFACFDWSVLKSIKKFALGMSGIAFTGLILTHVDKIILSKMLSLEMLGYYCLASSLAIGFTSLTSAIFSTYFPAFSQLTATEKYKQLNDLYMQASRVLSLFVIPAALFGIFFSPEILFQWTRDPLAVMHASSCLSCLMIGALFYGLMQVPYALQLAFGWTKWTFFQNIFGIFILIPLTIVATSYFGAFGAALAWTALACSYIFVVLPLMHRRWDQDAIKTWYKKTIGFSFAAAFLICSIGRYLLSAFFLSEAQLFFALALVFISSVLVVYAIYEKAVRSNTDTCKV